MTTPAKNIPLKIISVILRYTRRDAQTQSHGVVSTDARFSCRRGLGTRKESQQG